MTRESIEDAAASHVADDGSRERNIFIALFWASAVVPFAVHAIELGLVSSTFAAALLLTAVAVWIHVVHPIHRPPPDGFSRGRAILLLLVVYAVFGALLAIQEVYLLLLFGVYSITYGYAGTFRAGLWLSLIPTMLWCAAWIVLGLPLGALFTPLFVWVTSNVISYFTHRLAHQSEERRTLIAELQQTRTELATAERRRGTLEERARLAAEIHDTLAQGFTSIVLLAKGTAARLDNLSPGAIGENLGLIEHTARESLTDARRLVEALRPAALQNTSLSDAIGRIARRHQEETEIEVRLEVAGNVRPLGGSEDVLLLRATQEALANVRKHARAGTVSIRLEFDEISASVTVGDDGVGFDPDAAPQPVGGVVGGQGLELLRDRVRAVAGHLEVRSAPGSGTRITVRLPTAIAPAPESV